MSRIDDLLGAIRRGDAKAADALLAANPDLANARDTGGNSPLLIATYAGKQDLVRLLLERSARPSFFEACALGLVADVRRHLRENPGVVGAYAHDGWPPLHLAAYFGHRETAEALLDAGADVLASARNAEANLAINAAAAGPRADRRPDIIGCSSRAGAPSMVGGRRAATPRCTRPPTTEIRHSSGFCWTAAPIDRCVRARARRRWTSPASTDGTRSRASWAGDRGVQPR